jgi:hypothetical protein
MNMNKANFFRAMGLTLSLTLTLGQLPAMAMAAQNDGLCEHHSAHTADCGYTAEGVCSHSCSLDNGCITLSCSHEHVATCFDTAGNSMCRHDCDKDETCGLEMTSCLHTTHGGCGYAEGGICSFAEDGCDECEKEAALTTIVGTDVTIDGYKFTYTGEEIRPKITVKVGDQLLEEEKHYTLTYKDNVEAGTASVTVTGVEEAGYKGVVTIEFTIEKPVEETQPEETQPEETKPVEYTITKGSGSKWYLNSGKHLNFTVSSEGATGVSINGKALGKADFAVKEKNVTLNKSYLNKLTVGKYTITVHFADGDAKGTFTVSNELDTSNPATGDTIGMWAGAAVSSLAALMGAAYMMQKKCKK